jgi:acyl-CoA dehydrogenase
MQRQLFGKPLADQQNTQFRMAEMDTEIELVEIYVDHLVAAHNAGQLSSNMGAKAKMMASEVEWKMVDLGVQLHGGAGFMDEYPISRMFSDARINRILAGSSEVMRLIIGRDVFSQKYQSRMG